LTVLGSRKRGFINPEGNNIKLVIRRMKCAGCGKIHHELPDFLIPYKRHCAETIEQIIEGAAEGVCGEESTLKRVQRWFSGMAQYFAGCLESIAARQGMASAVNSGSLLRRIKDRFGQRVGWLKSLVRIIVNSNLWVHTRSEYLPA